MNSSNYKHKGLVSLYFYKMTPDDFAKNYQERDTIRPKQIIMIFDDEEYKIKDIYYYQFIFKDKPFLLGIDLVTSDEIIQNEIDLIGEEDFLDEISKLFNKELYDYILSNNLYVDYNSINFNKPLNVLVEVNYYFYDINEADGEIKLIGYFDKDFNLKKICV